MVYRLEFRPLRNQGSTNGGNEGKDKGTPRHQGTEPRGTRREEDHNRTQRKHDWEAHIAIVSDEKKKEEK